MTQRSTGGSIGQVPYFFLSYAHIPPYDSSKKNNPNKWVTKLFGDLCDHIINMTNLTHGSQAGFMDTELRSGQHWPDRLAEALSTCRVFVPLYSPRFFESEHCGKEWAAFLQRVNNHAGPNGQLPEAIVPALWTPIPPDQLPEVARSIQFTHDELGPRYREEGFYGLAKVSVRRPHYQLATLELAKRIVQAAKSTRIAPVDPPPYADLRSVFDDYAAERTLKLTVVAPDLTHLPQERNPYYYGLTPQEWNPYRGEHNTRPLAAYAAELASAHGFLAEVGSLDDHANDLAGPVEPEHPSLMLVDPWATTRPECKEMLRGFDQLDRPQVSVIVPWNNDDEQTGRDEPRLRDCLDDALHNRLSEASTANVGSLDAFRRALPDVLGRAANNFFKTAPTYPPAGPPTKKPRLLKTEEPDG
ncbi:TIR-like protein FxsC [Streptosporangium sp. NPDC000396]|uniref:TIR-like protein FxsC n=1 Tax=Streptosporangium sp. NPDC000396 TaxID=3366185 RepID=UPI0036BBAAD2